MKIDSFVDVRELCERILEEIEQLEEIPEWWKSNMSLESTQVDVGAPIDDDVMVFAGIELSED